MLDGGPGAVPTGRLTAWLVRDERSELRRELRALDAGCRLPFGEWGEPGRTYQLPSRR
jgi:hypothetical protein